MTNTPTATKAIDTSYIRDLDDEALDEAFMLSRYLPATLDHYPLAAAIHHEVSRRAGIRIERGMDAQYGPNPYGFTIDDVNAKHDASWYESRQTEEQFLAEMGVQA